MNKQTVGVIFFGFLSLIALCYLVAIFYSGELIRSGVNRIGPTVLKAPIVVDEATLGPVSGMGTLFDIHVGNPAGWSKSEALRISRVQLELTPFSIFEDTVVVKVLEIEKLDIIYETKPGASNLSDMLANAAQSLRLNGPETKREDGRPVRLIVKKFVLRKGTVTLSAGEQKLVVPMPEIHLVDLGVREGGLTPPQLGFAIIRSVTANVVAASTRALGTVGGPAGAAALENARQIGEAIKEFFGVERRM
jgi:hypothetical protein